MPNHQLSPWYQWYPRDFLASAHVRAMTYEEKGVYRDLLDMQWIEGGIPADLVELADLLQLPTKKFEKIWKRVGRCFEPSSEDENLLQHQRIEKIREEMIEASNQRSERARKAGQISAQKRNSKSTQVERESNLSSTQVNYANADANADNTSSDANASTAELTANAPALPGIEVKSAKRAATAEYQTPQPPDDLPSSWPEQGRSFKLLARRFLVAFGNCTDDKAQSRHGPAYVDALAAMSNRANVTPLDAWRAFGHARYAHHGKPLFGAQAKTAINYLRPVSRVTPIDNHPNYKSHSNVVAMASKPQIITPEYLAAMQ